MAKTKLGKTTSEYVQDVLKNAERGGERALEAGYPKLSKYTKKYLSQLPELKQYGDKEQRKALERSGDLYKEYLKAGKYKETDFGGIKERYKDASKYDKTRFDKFERQYEDARKYDKTKFADLERKYGKAGEYDKTRFADLERKYGKAGEYDKTKFSDIEKMYGKAGQYDAGEFTKANYKTKNIKQRMTPYEELVSSEAQKRLKKSYDEARGERKAEAVRAKAFGGSGAAIQEEVARRNYLEQSAQMNAQNLQNAYDAAVNLYGKEVADRLNSEQLGEASRQFAAQTRLSGIEGILGARQQTAAQVAAAKQAELAGLGGQMSAREQTAAQVAAAKQAELAGLEGQMSAREQTAAQIAAAKQAELAGIQGAMSARGMTAEQVAAAKQAELAGIAGMLSAQQQTAAQRAAAKEAEFASLEGASASARQQAALAEQQKNMQLTNLAALQQGGTQQENYNLAQRMYPLTIAQAQAGVLGGLQGGAQQLLVKPDQPSNFQTGLAAITAGGGVLQGLSDFGNTVSSLWKRDGGLIYRGGGLAELEPEYYDQYER